MNDVLQDKICFFYFTMVISGQFFFSFQFSSKDNESHAFLMTRTLLKGPTSVISKLSFKITFLILIQETCFVEHDSFFSENTVQ